MAKVYYVVEKGDDYSQVNFYQTEKEALKFGRSNIPDFEMGEEPMNDEEEDGDEFFNGDELTFNKGIMYTVQDGEVTIEAIDEDKAKEKAQALDEYSVAMFFDGFTEGMYGYQGTAADGKGYKWVWDGYDISESNTSSTKNKMNQLNEIKRMQQLAGVLKENIEESELGSESKGSTLEEAKKSKSIKDLEDKFDDLQGDIDHIRALIDEAEEEGDDEEVEYLEKKLEKLEYKQDGLADKLIKLKNKYM